MNMDKTIYTAPWAIAVELVTESFTLVSGLEDYQDNIIFNSSPAPEPDSITELF